VFELDLVAGLETDLDKVLSLRDGVELCHSEQKEGQFVAGTHAAVDIGECLQRIGRIPSEKPSVE
jgi:hypothetical protein